jgi:hypothetical protein
VWTPGKLLAQKKKKKKMKDRKKQSDVCLYGFTHQENCRLLHLLLEI